MVALVLASWLATQVWSWDVVEGATGYRVYWGQSPTVWCEMQRVELVAAAVCGVTRCEFDLMEPPVAPGTLAYFSVTALNGQVESVWDHGVKVGCL